MMLSSAPHSLNHAAYPTFDTGATYRFYTQVLGCPLVGAIRKDTVPSTGAQSPFLHTFFALTSGECLAFFEVDGLQRPEHGDGIPSWIRHIALNVESPEALAALKQRVEEHGVEVLGTVDHDGIWSSIYFFDPNGIRIELTYQSRPLDDDDAAQGRRLVEQWVAERSQSLDGAEN
jgi:catechol 2,3-dioxygenase-like lactoylglutathione lyase family enzyme